MCTIMKKNRIILFVICLFYCAYFFRCTTENVVTPGANRQTVSISLINEGVTVADFNGTKLDMIIIFRDSVLCDFNDIIKIHWIDGRFFVPDETFVNKKIKRVTIPIYWINKALLPKDSLTELYYDTIYVQNGLAKSNVLRVNVTNLSPFIDSLIVDDTSFLVTPRIEEIQVFDYYIDSCRDIPLRIIARDLDSKGGAKIAWENSSSPEYLVWNTITNSSKAVYKKRNKNFRDIITAVVYDTDASVQIKLNLSYLDGSEVTIDSISFKDLINDTVFTDTSTYNYSIQVKTLDTAGIQIYPHHTGGKATWSSNNGAFVSVNPLDTNGYAVKYICKNSKAKDTLNSDTVMLLDSIVLLYVNTFQDDSVSKNIILFKVPENIKPVIDSILIDTVMFKSNFNFVVNAGSSITLQNFAHDPEGGNSGGTIAYTWSGKTSGFLSGTSGDSISYTAASGTYTDSIYANAYDSLGFKTSNLISLTCNNYPRIDTFIIDITKVPVSANDSVYTYSTLPPDTISFKIKAHDIDTGSGDFITYTWNYKNANMQDVTSSRDSILYISGVSSYFDTINIRVNDIYGAEDAIKIILEFK
ncbi:MAG: hypothetical protein PVI26_11095 [Chitinispirillia bacterium]